MMYRRPPGPLVSPHSKNFDLLHVFRFFSFHSEKEAMDRMPSCLYGSMG
jgi:hypothetical protein